MGAQPTVAALTECRGGTAPAGSRLYVGIDVGRHEHLVAAIPQARMENGTWERAGVHRIPTSSRGFRVLTNWLETFDLDREQIRVGCEPTGWVVCADGGCLDGTAWLPDVLAPELGAPRTAPVDDR